ncbi:uncharacterized protein LOC100822388 [Brachypodium distachyon]|uniref:DUF868 domain-containing protein n=1 Tax=Brachypodium distachyon TaxID=15368 RepID=I1IUD9_BRADI|nr:uncharacterized protein LOC100822388 [Brachypodium distachyon]KQJ92279.1 hypothetical protein BRADI_4g42630v3 [Brachypodium distachyon]|eukprot:XP_003578915.1 uncharacterized protein LOC100822388 [Brachypodium distachyon]
MVSASSLLLPSSMRDLASCIGDGAVRVACASPASTLTSAGSGGSGGGPASTISVTACYRATLLGSGASDPAPPPLLLRLVWTHSPVGPTLSFSPSADAPAVLLRRRKGSRAFPLDVGGGIGGGDADGEAAAAGEAGDSAPLALFWDLTAARYDPGASSPEPLHGYYVVAVAGAEVALAVGDLAAEFVNAKFEGQISKARCLAVVRRERVLVADPAAMHTARVRFAEGGPEHEVSVGCAASSSAGAGEELWVSVDGKRAVQARRLRWNFRGNQTVFVDGAPVDVMWDLHGWWFRDPPGCAVVMLRARSALESRLWLEEEGAAPGFSLVVQAFRTPP